ncbi:hypothetical protein JTB14_002631 [Gonioctena quinquepunctata]|nr:hypothetical protein JTB14_002631 [Gonioctena quinquepunctata]
MEESLRTCAICLKNRTEDNNILIPLSTTDVNNETYLNKIYDIQLHGEFKVFEENWEICHCCSEDLNRACEIRKKLLSAVSFWKNWHTNIESVTVGNCRESERRAVNIEKISPETNNRVPTKFFCDCCCFQTSSEMLNHLCSKLKDERMPQNIQTYPCELCNCTFAVRHELTEHIKKAHTFSEAYISTMHEQSTLLTCDICGKTFNRLSSRKRHMQTHQAQPGEKSKKSPFLCSICGKHFPYSNGFQRHMRTHFAERRHRCNICGRTFGQSSHLKVHSRTHSGEKPYRCTECGFCFSLKSTLHKHIKSHKNSKNFVQIVQNLEPNLGQVDLAESKEFVNSEM